MCRSRGQKLLKRHGRVCCEGFEVVAETCPNVFCDPALQESPWEKQLRLALQEKETALQEKAIAVKRLQKAAKANDEKKVQEAKKEVQEAQKQVEAAEMKVDAAEKKVAAGPAQARSACS